MASLISELERNGHIQQRQNELVLRELLRRKKGGESSSTTAAVVAAAQALAAAEEAHARPAATIALLDESSAQRQRRAALPPPPQLVMPAGIAPFPLSGSTATAPQQPDAAHLLQQLLPGSSKGSQLAGQQEERGQGQELPAADRPCLMTYKTRLLDPSCAPALDFGPLHVPGWLTRGPGGSDAGVPNLPAKSGMGMRLRSPKFSPSSCVPPPYPEPIVPPDKGLGPSMSELDSRRLLNPDRLVCALVYDSLEAPKLRAAELPAPSSDTEGAAGEAVGAGARSSAGGDELSKGCGAEAGPDGEPAGGDRAEAGAAEGGRASGSPAGAAPAASGSTSVPMAASAALRLRARTAGRAARSAYRRLEAEEQGLDRSESMPNACNRQAELDAEAALRTEAGRRFAYFEDLPPWYCPANEADTTLVFESRFESGNLRRAIQVYPFEYDLVLHPDVNTRGHTQWFFFSVSNTRAGVPYKFNIINLMKDDSLYNDGMLPLVHSRKGEQATGLGWHRAGSSVAYYSNMVPRGRRRRYATLTFTLTFTHDFDVVHIAHCYPYTYTDLQCHLAALEADPVRKQYVRRETLTHSLAGNACDLLTITSPVPGGAAAATDALKRRRGVLLSARVHPGETNASWMMKGAIDYLTGPSLDARILRDNFVFKVVPMLNPDGVIVGNYRCSLAGMDLNRVWNDPSKKLHPVIYAVKALAKQLSEEREVVLFCDLHGHSRKKGIFMYGCEKGPKDLTPSYPGWPVPGSHGGAPGIPLRFQDKVLPLLLHHNLPDLFSYNACNFKVQKSKGGTGRVVGFRELGLVNSFTLEASFCGASTGRWADLHFNAWHLEQMGAAVPAVLLDYLDPDRYGMADLLAELEFIHPEGEAMRKVVRNSEGQLMEVEDDDPPTDSEDSESDAEERRKARETKRKQLMQHRATAIAAAAAAAAAAEAGGGGAGIGGMAGAAAGWYLLGAPGSTWAAAGAGADRDAWQSQGRGGGAGSGGSNGGSWDSPGKLLTPGAGPGWRPLQGTGSGSGLSDGGVLYGGGQTSRLNSAFGAAPNSPSLMRGGGSVGPDSGGPSRSGTPSRVGGLQAGGALGAVDSEPESPTRAKQSRKAAARKLNKALLQAEQAKASEALAACLPVLAARNSGHMAFAGLNAALMPGPSGRPGVRPNSGYYPGEPAGFGPGGAAAGEVQPGARVAAAAAGHAARDARPYPYVETLPATKLTPEALEYSKQRGIYRGEELSWANTGLSVLPPPPALSSHVVGASQVHSPSRNSSAAQLIPDALTCDNAGSSKGQPLSFRSVSSPLQGGGEAASSGWVNSPTRMNSSNLKPAGTAPAAGGALHGSPHHSSAGSRDSGAAGHAPLQVHGPPRQPGLFGVLLPDGQGSVSRRRNSLEMFGLESPTQTNAMLQQREEATTMGILQSNPLLQRR